MRCKIQFHPNPVCVTFHVTRIVTRSSIISVGSEKEFGPGYGLKKMPVIASKMFKIRGVKHVTLGRYEINLQRGDAFSWEEVIPGVVRTLEEHFASKVKADRTLESFLK